MLKIEQIPTNQIIVAFDSDASLFVTWDNDKLFQMWKDLKSTVYCLDAVRLNKVTGTIDARKKSAVMLKKYIKTETMV